MGKKHFHLKKAFLFGVIAASCFSVMALFVKLTAPKINNNMIVFCRFAISFFYILLLLGFKKPKISLKTEHRALHFFRAIVSLSTMFFLYFSLKFIPLVDGNLLAMTAALFVPVLGIVFFRHKTPHKHWGAVILGFIGIALILKPGHDLFNPMALFALAAGLCAAIGIMLIRELSKRDNRFVCMFYYFFFAFVISGFISIVKWESPNLHTLILLLGVGVFATFYQEFLILALSYGPARVISSIMYISLVFSVVFDWLFFKNFPDLFTWIGIVLVCLGSILTIRFAKES